MKWEDVTTYTKSDKDRVPKSWEIRINDLRIVVTRHFYHDPTDWVLICEPFCERKVISRGSIDEAKRLAIQFISQKLENTLNKLKEVYRYEL